MLSQSNKPDVSRNPYSFKITIFHTFFKNLDYYHYDPLIILMILTRPLRQWTRVTRRAVAVIHLFALAAPPGDDDDEDVILIWQPLLFSVQHSSSHILPYSHSLPHPNIHPQNHSHHHRHPHKSQIPPPPPNHDPHVKVKQEFVMWFRPYGFCYFKLR